MKTPALVKAALALWIGSCVCSQAIEIQGHTAAENDRFANDPSFIGASYDWTGVGRATTGTAGKGGHWATMISSNVFLSANHYHPSTGASLYFYPSNDAGTSPIMRTIASGQRIGTSDLWIGSIDAALPNTVSYYNWANQSLNTSTYATSIIADENALTAGITSTATGYGADRRTSMAIGRNVIDEFIPSLTVSGTTAPALRTLEDLSGDSNHVSYESQLASGDSGGPLFIDDGGELLLVGINWAIGQVDLQPGPIVDLRDASFYSYVGNYSTDIQNYVGANEPMLAPEPSVALTLLAGLGLLVIRRRR